MSKQLVQFAIEFCGWLYFIIWSLSFYGQIFTLLKQKSAMGMSSNYIFINLTGYAMYTVYNMYGFLKGNNDETGHVDKSDIFFSLHSVFAYIITTALFFYYPHQIKTSLMTKIYLGIQWFIFFYYGFESFNSVKTVKLSIFNKRIGYFQMLGYFKMFSTLSKHPPQLYHNFKRKSTKGWSIIGMLMDFTGGMFSFIQVLLQLYSNPKLHINITKLFLSVTSMVYDLTYIFQHYVLYRNVDKMQTKQQYNKISNNNDLQEKQRIHKPYKEKHFQSIINIQAIRYNKNQFDLN